MSAPRLLQKRQINAEVATQKKQQIIDGITLAKKVDKVRETLGEETARLELFRTAQIKEIQREIDEKIKERNLLEIGNKTLREERIRLEAPIDLVQIRDEVNQEKIEIIRWNERLIQEQVEVLAQKNDNQIRSEDLEKKERDIERKDIRSERNLIETESKFEETMRKLKKAEVELNDLLTKVKRREDQASLKELELRSWDDNLAEFQSVLKKKEVDISNREIALKNRYETFIRAKAYINNKK